MIRHLLISSAFLLASTVTSAVRVYAQEAGGSVAANCTFYNAVPGELILNSAGTILQSENGGTAASVLIDCNDAATLTISPPEQDIQPGTTDFPDTQLTATATSTNLPSINVISDGPGGNIPADTQEGKIIVNMKADNGSTKISAGKYSFTVTLTASP
ncbi:hypothetical protein H6G81_05290 [Scytonema hofmannii FACHB-248]|uniref:Spore coat protein U domain-containing protein n=1 Tax=Scytonema hofmannii FACHB-248 TaxID=1842502 RepID=A0ABR8GL93_9CYAN|nr:MULTISPECIES: hypothetical protein [Nostocales]MBD2603959.1 hypothetical protein [Scytonema hofmannii FACHB-248]